MTPHAKRLWIASTLSPLSVVVVSVGYALWYMLSWIGKPMPGPAVTLIWPHPFKPWEAVALYSLYGVPTAYACLLLVGLPLYFVARKLHLLSYFTAAAAALLSCLPGAWFFGGPYHFFPLISFSFLTA